MCSSIDGSSMEFYTVLDLNQAPKRLRRIGESHDLYCYFPPPLPEVIVVFALQWPDNSPDKMTIQLFLDSEHNNICKVIGEISKDATSFCFKGDWKNDEKSVAQEIQTKGRLIKLLVTPLHVAMDDPDSQDSGVSDALHTLVEADCSPFSKWDAENEEKRAHQDVVNKDCKKSTSGPPLVETKQTPKRGVAVKRKSLFDFDDEKTEDCKKQAKDEIIPDKTEDQLRQEKGSRKTTNTPKGKEKSLSNFFSRKTKTPNGKSLKTTVAKSPATPGFLELKAPSPRWGHTFCQTEGSKAFIIGGQGARNQICKDSVWQFDCESKTFERMAEDSSGASRRMGHTAVYDERSRQIYIFGGSKNKKWYSDVHVLNTDTMTWSSVEPTGKPPVRAYHSCTLVHDELLIFGGVFPNPDPIPDGCSNDVYFFNTESNSWYQPIVSGDKPSARSGHSACLLDGLLYIFGGWDAPACFNDLWTLDIGLMSYKRVEVTGQAPSPRSWHGATLSSDQQNIVISGGYNGEIALNDVHLFRIASKSWYQVKSDNLIPRAGHQLLSYKRNIDNGKHEESVMIFGGGNNEGDFFNDLLQIPSIYSVS